MYFSAMYVDIARRSSARGRQTTVRWQKQVLIHTRLSRAYLALARLSCHDSWWAAPQQPRLRGRGRRAWKGPQTSLWGWKQLRSHLKKKKIWCVCAALGPRSILRASSWQPNNTGTH